MTIALENQVEELRAELRNADPAERRQIAEQDGTIDADPPF